MLEVDGREREGRLKGSQHRPDSRSESPREMENQGGRKKFDSVSTQAVQLQIPVWDVGENTSTILDPGTFAK